MPDNKFNVVRRDGSITQATEAQFAKLEKLGYTREGVEAGVERATEAADERHYTSLGQKVVTAGEGLASGVSLGLTDLVLDGEGSQKRANFNPGTRVGGEIVGAVGAAIATGGTSAPGSAAATGGKLAAKALSYTPAGALGKASTALGKSIGGVKGVVAGAAAEGFVAGAGGSITNAKMADDPVTVDSVFAGAGWSAIFGAGLGGVVGGVSKAADNMVTSRAAREAVESQVDDVAKELDTLKSYVNPIKEDDFHHFSRSVEEFTATAPAVGKVRTEAAGAAKAMGDQVESLKAQVKSLDKEFKTTRSTVAKEAGEVEGVVAKTRAEVSKAYDTELKVIQKTKGDAAKQMIKTFDGMSIRPADPYYTKYHEINDVLETLPDDTAKATKIMEIVGDLPGDHPILKHVYKFDDVTTGETSKVMERSLRLKELDVEIADLRAKSTAKIAGSEAAITARREAIEAEIASFQKQVGEATKTAEKYGLSERSIKALSRMPDTSAGFVALKPDKAGEVMGALDSLLNTDVSEYMHLKTAVTDIIDRMVTNSGVVVDSTSPVDRLRKVYSIARESTKANKLKTIEFTLKHGAAAKVAEESRQSATKGFISKVAAQASSRGASSAIRGAGGGAVTSSVAYQGAGMAMSFLTGHIGSVIGELSGIRSAVQNRVINAVAKMNPTKNSAVRHAIPRISALTIRLDGTFDDDKKQTKVQLAKARSIEIAQAAGNVKEVMFNSLTPLIGEHTEYAAATQKRGVEIFNTLLELIPRDPGTAMNNMKSMWSPNPVQAIQTERILQVFHNPLEVIEEFMTDIATIDPTRANALQRLYPPLFDDFRMRVIERVADIGDMDYNNQARLSILLKLDLHSSFTSQAIASRQAHFMEVPEESKVASKSPNPAGTSGGRPGKMEPPTPGQSLMNKVA